MNRLLKANAEVYWLKGRPQAGGQDLGTGAIWVPASAARAAGAAEGRERTGRRGLRRGAKRPRAKPSSIQPVRIGLYDQYGGLMPSGWTRWMFEQYEFPFEVVYPQTLDAGNLQEPLRRAGVSRWRHAPGRGGRRCAAAAAAQSIPQDVPEEYRGWLGRITEEKTIPQIKQFVESGGAVVTVGSSTSMAELLGVPCRIALTEKGPMARSVRCRATSSTFPAR